MDPNEKRHWWPMVGAKKPTWIGYCRENEQLSDGAVENFDLDTKRYDTVHLTDGKRDQERFYNESSLSRFLRVVERGITLPSEVAKERPLHGQNRFNYIDQPFRQKSFLITFIKELNHEKQQKQLEKAIEILLTEEVDWNQHQTLSQLCHVFPRSGLISTDGEVQTEIINKFGLNVQAEVIQIYSIRCDANMVPHWVPLDPTRERYSNGVSPFLSDSVHFSPYERVFKELMQEKMEEIEGIDVSHLFQNMYLQVNSEHCRHHAFNQKLRKQDGSEFQLGPSLLDMIKETSKNISRDSGKEWRFPVLSAYEDNSAVLELSSPSWGRKIALNKRLPQWAVGDSEYLVFKVETHNHPTGVSPFPGATTGVGGEIRDEVATGMGGQTKAGVVGYFVSDVVFPAQFGDMGEEQITNLRSALEITAQAPLGASNYSNSFGRPTLSGIYVAFSAGMHIRLGGLPIQREKHWSKYDFAFDKPVMIAGGVGTITQNAYAKTQKESFQEQECSIFVLGPSCSRIGLGGAAASSAPSEGLPNIYSVQKEAPHHGRMAHDVIGILATMEPENPLVSIHDVGAGGLSNAVPELLIDSWASGEVWLDQVPQAEQGMGAWEIWGNESQERFVLLVPTVGEKKTQLLKICAREGLQCANIGFAKINPNSPKESLRLRILDQKSSECTNSTAALLDIKLSQLIEQKGQGIGSVQRHDTLPVPTEGDFVKDYLDTAEALQSHDLADGLQLHNLPKKQFFMDEGQISENATWIWEEFKQFKQPESDYRKVEDKEDFSYRSDGSRSQVLLDLARQVREPKEVEDGLKMIKELALRCLAHPTVASKSFLIHIGDRTVGGLTIQDQMLGSAQLPIADAAISYSSLPASSKSNPAILLAMGSRPAIAIGCRWINSLPDRRFAEASVRMAIAESLTNAVGAGWKTSERNEKAIALSANWMVNLRDLDREPSWRESVQLIAGVNAASKFCQTLGIPIPMGKDSLSMSAKYRIPEGLRLEKQQGAYKGRQQDASQSPLTLVVTCTGRVSDPNNSISAYVSRMGAKMTLIAIRASGVKGRLGGSILQSLIYKGVTHWEDEVGFAGGDDRGAEIPPDIDDAIIFNSILEQITMLVASKKLQALHDRSDGGIFATLAELAMANTASLQVQLSGLLKDYLGGSDKESQGEHVDSLQVLKRIVSNSKESAEAIPEALLRDISIALLHEEAGWVAVVNNDSVEEVVDRLKGSGAHVSKLGNIEKCASDTANDAGMKLLIDDQEVIKWDLFSKSVGGKGIAEQVEDDLRNDLDFGTDLNNISLMRAWHHFSDRIRWHRRDKEECIISEAVWRNSGQLLLKPSTWGSITSQFNRSPLATASNAPQVAVLREPGINGASEMAAAFTHAGFEAFDVTLGDLEQNSSLLQQFDVVAFPGGFSHRDVGPGGSGFSMAQKILLNPALRSEFEEHFANANKLTLGICNGCQVLSHLVDLMPEGKDTNPQQSWPNFHSNVSNRFEARLVQVRIGKSKSVFLNGLEGLDLLVPISCGEGRTMFNRNRKDSPLQQMQDSGGIAGHYVNPAKTSEEESAGAQIADNPDTDFPFNPTGAEGGVIGVTAGNGRILAMMPHPERVFLTEQLSWAPDDWGWKRALDAGDDPEWCTKKGPYSPWMMMFENAYRFVMERRGDGEAAPKSEPKSKPAGK